MVIQTRIIPRRLLLLLPLLYLSPQPVTVLLRRQTVHGKQLGWLGLPSRGCTFAEAMNVNVSLIHDDRGRRKRIHCFAMSRLVGERRTGAELNTDWSLFTCCTCTALLRSSSILGDRLNFHLLLQFNIEISWRDQ